MKRTVLSLFVIGLLVSVAGCQRNTPETPLDQLHAGKLGFNQYWLQQYQQHEMSTGEYTVQLILAGEIGDLSQAVKFHDDLQLQNPDRYPVSEGAEGARYRTSVEMSQRQASHLREMLASAIASRPYVAKMETQYADGKTDTPKKLPQWESEQVSLQANDYLNSLRERNVKTAELAAEEGSVQHASHETKPLKEKKRSGVIFATHERVSEKR